MYTYVPSPMSGVERFVSYYRHIETTFKRLTDTGGLVSAYNTVEEEFILRQDGNGCLGLGEEQHLYAGSTAIAMENDGIITNKVLFSRYVVGCGEEACGFFRPMRLGELGIILSEDGGK